MIETSFIAWLILIGILLLASCTGIVISRKMPWSNEANISGIPFTFGLALAPFILGICIIITLLCFPKANHYIHFGVVVLLQLLFILGMFFFRNQKIKILHLPFHKKPSIFEIILIVFLCIQIISLLINSLFIPLMQNDSLEYVTVGKALYESRSLITYPVINPETNSSGFIGPWTHPPLYFSLIYFTNIIQGHVDSPGLMRVIAPWTTLVSALLIFSITKKAGRKIALLSTILFLSPPLYFLGTASALIDSIVVLGATIVMVTIFSFKGDYRKKAILQGLFLGLALWTHSQALLLVPIMLFALLIYKLNEHRKFLFFYFAIILIVCFLVSAWPYWRNIQIFGSPISDNPKIFALKELAWDEYFAVERGIDTVAAKLQYGFFKGWFALEAYGSIFWLMLIGFITLCFKALKAYNLKTILFHNNEKIQKYRWLISIISILACYYFGLGVSLLISTDLMIKNERYLLIILPSVSILAGYGAFKLIYYHSLNKVKKILIKGVLIIIVLLFTFQLYLVSTYWWKRLELNFAQIAINEHNKLKNWAPFNAMNFLEQNTDSSACVFSLKPADMVYSKRKMISYLDERLIPFYKEIDLLQGYKCLVNLGISYIYMPNYSLPPVYNSTLIDIIGRPDLTQLVFEQEGYRIYKLVNGKNRLKTNSLLNNYIDITPGKVSWTRDNVFIIGGRKKIYSILLSHQKIDSISATTEKAGNTLFQRDCSTILSSDKAFLRNRLEKNIQCEFYGNALLLMQLYQYDGNGILLSKYQLDELVMGKNNPISKPSYRFFPKKDCKYISISIEYKGNSSINIKSIKIF